MDIESKTTHWSLKEITEIPNVFVSYFAPRVTNLTTNWLRLLPCQRMLTQVYFLWWESGGENESKRFCFQSAANLLQLILYYSWSIHFYSIYSIFRQSTSNPTKLISFYLFVIFFFQSNTSYIFVFLAISFHNSILNNIFLRNLLSICLSWFFIRRAIKISVVESALRP